MSSGKFDFQYNKKGLEIFFHTLLGVKTNRICRTLIAQFKRMSRSFQVVVGLGHPLTGNYGGLVIFGHRELPLDGRQAIQ